jgi:asparagine synthase (glutamine-hydrolysing)
MSILWGVLKGRGAVVDQSEIRQLGSRTARYATGPSRFYAEGRMGMGVQLGRTHHRSQMDQGLVSDTAGNVVSFDGRLDNVRALASLLDLDEETTSDSEIALAAYLRWEDESFSRLTGDWALALWSARTARLILARDHAGTRTLYFHYGRAGLLWSTYLDTFQSSDLERPLSECYVASYLACLPTRNRTPYEDLLSVRPGHYLIFTDELAAERQHWSPLVRTSIRYGSEREYDEQFLALFGQSVARRTGPGAPILAHLSGGMDSTSIVCMSDHLRRSADRDASLLDTISFYDDSEASFNEREYFMVTEAKRGKSGIHLNTATPIRTFEPVPSQEACHQVPGADSSSVEQEKLLHQLIWKPGYRIIISGLGGDEVLGGVPTGQPELADLLMTGNIVKLLRQSIAWCLADRSPLLHSLYGTARFSSMLYLTGASHKRMGPPWLSKKLRKCASPADLERRPISERLRFKPHQLDNAETWSFVMESLPHTRPQHLFRPEYRYPMLDKDLVEFLFSIPREQLVRPGRRRAMMRRALRGIVPAEILERKRKAFVLQGPLRALQQARGQVDLLWRDSLMAQKGFIDVDVLRRELDRCLRGDAEWSQALTRTIAYELWLRSRQAAASVSVRA